MASKTPYLDAIQKIPGETAKDKHKSLNKIIKEIIESKKAPGDFAPKTLSGSQIPEKLQPLIQIEVAKVLKNTDDVITALKSEDISIVMRALKAKWFFDGSDKNITNFPNFLKKILEEVSINTRALIIQRLTQYLGKRNEYWLAKEFFIGIRTTYNLNQAMPLLTACRENYIARVINDGGINLPKKVVKRLFPKYPVLMIRYLKLCKPENRQIRNVTPISISAYIDLLPLLISNYIDDFIDIVNSFENPLDIKLGNKRSGLFLKSKGVDALIEFPRKYLAQCPLKLVTRELSKHQFQLMYENLFPKKQENFNLTKMLAYLKFQPENVRLSLITETFKNVYGVDLVSCLDYVTPDLLLMLPEEERINVAEKKLAEDPDFKQYHPEKSWVAYLITEDAIALIKNEISKSKEVDVRASLASTLIYTCKVNKSEKHLLRVLEFLSSKHRNEISTFWWTVYESLLSYFELENLSKKHWKILYELIQRSNVKDKLMERVTTAQMLLEKSVHYFLANNLSIEKTMILLTEIKIKCWNGKFNIIVKNPIFEKLCLEQFIEIMSTKFPESNQIWKDNKVDTIHQLTEALYNYNERIAPTAREGKRRRKKKEKQEEEKLVKERLEKEKLERKEKGLLSIEDYPWLREQVKSIIFQERTQTEEMYQPTYKIDKMKRLLEKYERSLYDTWFPQKRTIARVYEQEGLKLLKKSSGQIFERKKLYFDSCLEHIHYPLTKRFLKKCIWYNKIPIEFVEAALEKINENNLMILALLLRGPEFEQIIKPLVDSIPDSYRIDIKRGDAKKSFRIIRSIPPAINQTNPPPSLDLVGRFLKGDYLSLGLISLINVSRRTPVNNVMTFANSLTRKQVSVKKHGIRLMCLVAPTANLYIFLKYLWEEERHASIRDIVFNHTYNYFTKNPSRKNWLLMKSCIQGLTLKDVQCFNTLVKIKNVPNEYIKDYFEEGLTLIEKLTKAGLGTSLSDELIHSFLRKATSDVCAFFTEDYCQSLVKKYAFDCSAGRLYAVETFLIQAGDKLESRLIFFFNLLSDAISKNWNTPDPTNSKLYPIRRSFNKIIENIVISEVLIRIDERIPETMQRLFHSILSPVQDFNSYLKLIFVIEFRKAEFEGRLFGLLVGTHMRYLLETFSREMMAVIAEVLSDFLSPLMMSPTNDGNFIGSVILGLAEVTSLDGSILAAIMLSKHHTLIADEQYGRIVEMLKKIDHLAVVTNLNNVINSFSANSTITNCKHN